MTKKCCRHKEETPCKCDCHEKLTHNCKPKKGFWAKLLGK